MQKYIIMRGNTVYKTDSQKEYIKIKRHLAKVAAKKAGLLSPDNKATIQVVLVIALVVVVCYLLFFS